MRKDERGRKRTKEDERGRKRTKENKKGMKVDKDKKIIASKLFGFDLGRTLQ